MSLPNNITNKRYGILEELEFQVKSKINRIDGLLELSNCKHDTEIQQIVKNICDSFADVNELFKNFTEQVIYENSLGSYMSDILKANQAQEYNVQKLLKIKESRGIKVNNTSIRPQNIMVHQKVLNNASKMTSTRLKPVYRLNSISMRPKGPMATKMSIPSRF